MFHRPKKPAEAYYLCAQPAKPGIMIALHSLKNSILKEISTPAGLAFWSANLLVVSMVLSPFLLSISMWFLVFAAWWHTAQSLGSSLRKANTWWKVLIVSFSRLLQRRELAAMFLILLAPALSFFWSDDKAYWLRMVQTSLPFLVLPWAFANFPPLTERQYRSVLYLFVWFMVGVCLAVGIHFALHFDAIIEGLGRGNPIPVPRSHVRFSLILATAILVAFWLWKEGFVWKWPWERTCLALAGTFLFIFIHILSVRGGLFSLYAALVFGLLRYIWQSKKWGTGLAALFLLLGGLWLASETVPSLKMRIAYMKYDWERFNAQDSGHLYSDAARWVSLKSGWHLWQQNPLLGAGAGDLLSETKRVTTELFPTYSQEARLPHNQFLFIMAGTGLFGLTLGLIALFWPIYIGRKNALFIAFQIMALASFLIECTIENAIGVAWFLFYSLWFLSCKQKNPSVSTF